MIYLFSGDDTKNKYLNYEKFSRSIPAGAENFFVSKNNFDKNQLESFYSGDSLFSSRHAVYLENILEREEPRDFILSKLGAMAESPNYFIFLEGKLNKPIFDSFKNARAELRVFELPKAKKEKFDNFLLARALGDRDKLGLWIYFRQAVDLGVGMEELVGVLFWKAKDMLLKKNFSRFSQEELENFASKISYILPEARKEGKDGEAVFEKFILEAF